MNLAWKLFAENLFIYLFDMVRETNYKNQNKESLYVKVPIVSINFPLPRVIRFIDNIYLFFSCTTKHVHITYFKYGRIWKHNKNKTVFETRTKKVVVKWNVQNRDEKSRHVSCAYTEPLRQDVLKFPEFNFGVREAMRFGIHV